VLAKNKESGAAAAEAMAKRGRGRHTLYTYEDEMFEQQIRRDLAAKRKDGVHTPTYTERARASSTHTYIHTCMHTYTYIRYH
jgi:hypothetical protein